MVQANERLPAEGVFSFCFNSRSHPPGNCHLQFRGAENRTRATTTPWSRTTTILHPETANEKIFNFFSIPV